MKGQIKILCMCALCLPLMALAQEHPDHPSGDQPDKEATMSEEDMMKAWMEMNAPGSEHEELAQMAGEYTYESTYWMAPGAEPTTSTGTTSIKTILDGRYLIEKHEGDMGGMTFRGYGITAFDKQKEMYQFAWADNMNTGLTIFEGKETVDGNVVSSARVMDPMSGQMQTHKVVTGMMDGGYWMKYYLVEEGGSDFKMMDVKYTKKQ